MNPLGTAYGHLTTLRRAWYARSTRMQQRLPRPVISVGNLVAGGSGKTPVVAALAQMLLRQGERPAILSRGYRRRTRPDDVIVVSDGKTVLVPVRDSGDEPQLLARMLPDVPVVVCARRYRAGEVAVSRFDVSVILLDDGFQHLELARDLDLLVASASDFEEQLIPFGVLREPLAAARAAHAVIVPGSQDEASAVAARLGVSRAFSAVSHYEPFRSATGAPATVAPGARALAVAGIARPERFFAALGACDLHVVREIVYADHHWFRQGDIKRIESAARREQATVVVTTEKDAMRLGEVSLSLTWVTLPLRVALTPEAEVASWIRRRLDKARSNLPSPSPGPSR